MPKIKDLAGLRKLDFRVTELKEQINLMTKHQAGADEKLCQLEAENKRLLDAVKTGISAMQNSEGKIYGGKCKEFNSMQAALAQTGEK